MIDYLILKIMIDSEHYLFTMRSIFCFDTCCWTLTDNMGGGGVIDYILCFLFSLL